jgi:hypothetical protein
MATRKNTARKLDETPVEAAPPKSRKRPTTHETVLSVLAARRTYMMIANDSKTRAQYTWLAVGAADWAGTGYPGPNKPKHIAVSQVV